MGLKPEETYSKPFKFFQASTLKLHPTKFGPMVEILPPTSRQRFKSLSVTLWWEYTTYPLSVQPTFPRHHFGGNITSCGSDCGFLNLKT